MAFVSPFIANRLLLAAPRAARPYIVCLPPYTPRRLTTSANAANRQTTERGFKLLRSDFRRLRRLATGDFSVIVDRQIALYRYDSVKIADYYDARQLSALVRVTAVGIPFLAWLFKVRKWDKWRGVADDTDVTLKRADELRKLLCWAGPTYLKIGQAVGNRPDLVGVIYSNELQKLVDDVGTFDSDVAVAMVKKELQIEQLEDVFSYFEPDAVASASLGQVHKAILRSGDHVAVKVQRPTVERDAALDVYVLRKAAFFAKKRFELRSDLVGIVDEFAFRLWEELDYVNEADNCDRFRSLYATASDDVCVPAIYREYTTKRILCMEWIDGDKAPWFPKEDAQRLIKIGVQCSLNQLLDKGFVHADPHGGNLLRTNDGKLCYLDFGMCVDVEKQIRNDLVAAIVRLINRDYDNLAKDFVKLGFLPPDADTAPLGPLLEKAFGDASTGSELSDLSFSKLADNLSGLAFVTPIRIPVFFTLIIRSLTILEGFALQTDASFKIVDESYPYVVSRVLTDDSPEFQRALEGVLLDDNRRIRWDRLDSLLRTNSASADDKAEQNHVGDSGRNQLAGVSDAAINRVVDFVLSERGKFLRDALQRELVDTVDAAQLAFLRRVSQITAGILPAPREEIDVERLERAIDLAQALRSRAPELLFNNIGGRTKERNEYMRRQEQFREVLKETTRTVAGGILERNSRRLFRKSIDILLGETGQQKD